MAKFLCYMIEGGLGRVLKRAQTVLASQMFCCTHLLHVMCLLLSVTHDISEVLLCALERKAFVRQVFHLIN